jgi:two-component system, OmpR family, catabolic regulation response regulator CreB
MSHILIVEDEMSIADTLVFALGGEGFATHWVRLGSEAIDCVQRGMASMVILDVGLPDMSGFEVCKAIRRHSEVPILFLTARAEEIDRVVGLEIGADDYVVKPFSPREVAARVRAILKRTRANAAATPPHAPSAPTAAAAAGPFQLDSVRLQISHLGAPLELTPHEYRLLAHLLAHPERVFSRQQLLDAIGAGSDAVYERNIDGHIKSLRAKLRAVAPDRDPIQTHRGFGYSYQPDRVASGGA